MLTTDERNDFVEKCVKELQPNETPKFYNTWQPTNALVTLYGYVLNPSRDRLIIVLPEPQYLDVIKDDIYDLIEAQIKSHFKKVKKKKKK